MKKLGMLLSAVLLAGLLMAGCSSSTDSLSKIKSAKKIVWGTNAAFVPFESNGGDKVVGVVHVAKTPEKQHLHALYIAKEYYGSGLAQRLMEIGLAWADPHRPIDLQVATYNERAKAFYRKYGFEEVPGTEEKFAETIPVVTMERKGESA